MRTPIKEYASRALCWAVVGIGAFLLAPLVGLAAEHRRDAASGGDTTRTVATGNAFSSPARNLPPQWRQRFFDGNKIFNAVWVAPPNADTPFVGLGPTFNASSCADCHARDGRGAPPQSPDEPMLGMLVRVSIAGTDSTGGALAHPALGLQINSRAVSGVQTEGRVDLTYVEAPGQYGDGIAFSLRAPRYAYAPSGMTVGNADLLLSPRVAPAVFGLGLLAAIAEDDIASRADPDDVDGDGISGRANRVWDAAAGAARLGRFGWKANSASLRDQNAAALLGDMGITSDVFPDENCPPVQVACVAAAANGKGVEASGNLLDDLTFYMESVAVPARRRIDDPAVVRGEALFEQIGCSACHTPRLTTGDHPNPVVAHQTIQPFTDLLLHDMGDGLADGRPDFLASGREWRTPPLWGLGLIETVNGHEFLLHDGRARGVAEAILWHGGEAEAARERFRTLPADRRMDLLTFLRSL